MVTNEFIQKVVSFFTDVFEVYVDEIDKHHHKYRFYFDFYSGNSIYAFYSDKLIIKRNYDFNDKIKIIENPNPEINIEDADSLKYLYPRLNKVILQDTKEYGRKMVEDEFNQERYKFSEGYEEYIEKESEEHFQAEDSFKKDRAKKHEEYLSSINKVIKKTCNKNYYELDIIWDYFDFFFGLKLPDKLKNMHYLSSLHLPSMIHTFIDLLTIGNYDATYIPLRQIFESFVRALYFDIQKKQIGARDMIQWFEQNKRDEETVGGEVISCITKKQIFRRQSFNLRAELRSLWSELSFRLHKHDFDVKLAYGYDSQRFKLLYTLFVKLFDLLITTLVFNSPDIYDQMEHLINHRKKEIKMSLLENK